MKNPLNPEQLSLPTTVEKINRLETTINSLRIHTRRPDVYPFDTVAGECVCKAFALSRASILLVEQGYPDEAFGLCRSLYECSVNLRYITQQPEKLHERAARFLEFGVSSKAFWFDLLNQSPNLAGTEREEIERYKAENRIPSDPKRMFQPWSEVRRFIEQISEEPHPADARASTKNLRSKERAVFYTDTSTFVHCTQPGLNAYTHDWKEPLTIRKSRAVGPNNALKTCMLIQIHLRAVNRYCLFGMGLISIGGGERQL